MYKWWVGGITYERNHCFLRDCMGYRLLHSERQL
nr:MAG TPA: hypothetical protein [Bacteriophage sp.]